MDEKKHRITVTPNLINVLAANPGISISQNQLTSIVDGNTVLKGGCVRRLFYTNNSEDLDIVFFDNGDSISESQAKNLKDFRESFECAAKHGLGATFCWDRSAKKIFMVNLYPCLCTCKDREGSGKGEDARAFDGLSRS